MKVLVTGASGLIGRHTVDALLSRGDEVRSFQRGEPAQDIETVQGDVCTDPDRLRAAARGCEGVVHLAGEGDVAASRRDPLAYAQLNATGALHALEAARASDASFILASTQRIYPLAPQLCREDDAPAPDSPYGFAKLAAELWCRMENEQFSLPCSVLRFFSVYGPGQQPAGSSGVVAIFARAAMEGGPLSVQSRGRRDFTDARDVADGVVLALSKPPSSLRTLNIATGIGTSFSELARHVKRIFNSSSPVREEGANDQGADLVADCAAAAAELAYRPRISLAAGLEHYRDYLLGVRSDSRSSTDAAGGVSL